MSALAKSNGVSPARLTAFHILRRVDQGAYASVLLASADGELNQLDRRLCQELVLGVLRWQLWLDHLIEYYSNRRAVELDAAVRLALRLGLYQLRFLSRIPQSAAVNESVELTKIAHVRSAGGLVNAVLRRAIREPEVDPSAQTSDPIERLAIESSHPGWLIQRWVDAFGFDEARAFALANNEPATVTFRVVANRGSEADVIERLRDAGIEVERSSVASGAWRINSGGAVPSEMITAGEVYLQDEASQLVAQTLNPKPGQRLLDLCAAPGSKATQIADITGDSACVLASDLHEHRLRTIKSSLQTQGLKNVHCVAVDGLKSLPFPESAFDSVLVDAPCSGTGTLRRNPEIRWRITTADLRNLSGRQTQLLANAARVVKPGGRLVYSTCSVETEENEDVRQAFLENNNNFSVANLHLNSSLRSSSGSARTWPHRHGTDGFFMCAFTRLR